MTSGLPRPLWVGVIAAAILPANLALAAAPPPQPTAATVPYAVRAGDTLYRLAGTYLTGLAAIAQVRRINRIGNVRRLPVGGVLRIPRALLRDVPTPARVESFSGAVTLRRRGIDSALPATSGASLSEGTVIETGPRGFLSLRLADDSTVTIPSQSAVQVLRLRRILINNAVEREFRALSGRVRAKVTPMSDPSSSFRVGTPITVSAVRGTEFRVAFDPAKGSAQTAVEDGKVQFALARPSADTGASRGAELVPGFGAWARPEGLGAVTPLLSPPRLIAPERVQSDPQLDFAIEPDPAAVAYRIQIGRDAGLLDLVDEARTDAPRVQLPGLPTGTYFARISAIDGNGIEGLGRTYAFDRVLNTVAGAVTAEGGRYRFKWSSLADGQPQFRFRLVRIRGGAAPSLELPLIDEPLGSETELTVASLRPGTYGWQVLSIASFAGKVVRVWSAPQQFEVARRQ